MERSGNDNSTENGIFDNHVHERMLVILHKLCLRIMILCRLSYIIYAENKVRVKNDVC